MWGEISSGPSNERRTVPGLPALRCRVDASAFPIGLGNRTGRPTSRHKHIKMFVKISCGIDSVALSGLGCSWLETRGGALRACPWLHYAAPAALTLCIDDALTDGREL